jgi:hypothetical protein
LHKRASLCRKGPDVPSQGLDLAEPVMYLSWTDDLPIVYPLYTCATGNVQDECLTLMGVALQLGQDRTSPQLIVQADFWHPQAYRRSIRAARAP